MTLTIGTAVMPIEASATKRWHPTERNGHLTYCAVTAAPDDVMLAADEHYAIVAENGTGVIVRATGETDKAGRAKALVFDIEWGQQPDAMLDLGVRGPKIGSWRIVATVGDVKAGRW